MLWGLLLTLPVRPHSGQRERENSCVSPGLASGVEGRKLPQRQKGQPGFDSGPAGVDLWEDAPNLPPHREPSARKVSGRLCSGLSEERGMRGLRTCKTRQFSRGHERRAGTGDTEGCAFMEAPGAPEWGRMLTRAALGKKARAGAGERGSKGTSGGCEAAVTNTPARGLTQQTDVYCAASRGREPEVQVWAGLVSPEASLLGVQMLSPPRVLTWLSLCMRLCPAVLFI